MSDYNSSLPVRTQNNGDVVINIADGTTETQLLSVDSSGRLTIKLDDGSGNLITSQANGSQRALDVGIDVAGVQVDPRSIRALTSADVVTANQGAVGAAAWLVKDNADGPVTPGTVAANSLLIGGQYNSTLPTLTTAQQAALQVDSSGRLIINIGASTGTVAVTQSTSPWVTSDLADGSVAAGTAGTKSMLGGLVYNSAAPTLTTGQQVALQGDVNGNLKVDLATALPAGSNSIGNIGTVTTVSTVTAVTAITNALPAGTNTIGAVNQGTPNTVANAWPIEVTNGTSTAFVTPASTAALAANPALVVGLSPNSPVPAGTNAIGSVLANLQVSSAPVTVSNPVPVTITSASAGTPIQFYGTSVALAAGSSATITYTVPATHTFSLERMWASASGKIKAVFQNNGTTIFVGFNSTATPNIDVTITAPPSIVAGNTASVVITNEDKAAMDVYATIEGNQIS